MGNGCRKKVRTLKIKKVDDKPMVIHTKEKAKIHAHEPKGAKIKGSNIYTVERGPKVHDAKANEMDKKASAKLMLQKSAGGKRTYRKSTIHQSEAKDKGLSRFKRNIRESGTSIKTKNTNLHIAGRTGALAAGAVTEQVEGGQEVSQAAYLAYEARGAIKTTDKDIAKTALLAKGFREAGQTVANAFRTFADKPEVDYSQKEQKHPITKAVLAPMKAVKKMLVSMKLHLDASIDKLDNLAMNVQLDKEKHMENAKAQEQTEPERAEAEQVEAEIVYAPMVAETHEYQYNADAFEARDADEVKQEAAYKEVSKVREDKAR